MLEAFNTDRKRQYAADLDFQLWQFGADRAARSKQLSMLSPEEIAIFQEQARQQALAQAQQQMQEATGEPIAQLPGQSLDEVNDPSDKEERAALLKRLLAPLYTVYGIFLTRKQKPASERKRLKESQPVRLVLGDWYGTYQELLARLTKDELQGVLSMIRQIITIGRDMGVGLVVDTQSANLDSLGLANDASIRQSLDIFSQGFIYYQDGEEKGELQTIRLMFGNKSICSPEDREAIALAYNALADAIKDGQLKTPIIFTSVGSRPRLGIVPELTDGIATQTNIDWQDVVRRLDAQYLRSEFGVIVPEPSEPPSEPLNQSDDKAYSQNTSRFTPLNFTREQVLELIKQLRTAELNQTQIIERLWQVRKGGSAAWKDAYQQFRELTGE